MNAVNQDLQKFLFSVADHTRGELDTVSTVELMLHMLLLKRVADLAAAAGGITEQVDLSLGNRRGSMLRVDDTLHWARLLSSPKPDRELEQMLRALAQRNPHVLADLARHLDLKRFSGRIVEKLAHVFQRHDLGSLAPSALGEAVDELLGWLDAAYGMGAPLGVSESVQRLVKKFSEQMQPAAVFDPSCMGGLLLAGTITETNYRKISLAGCERNQQAWRLCKLGLLLRGVADAELQLGDSLREPLQRGAELAAFDLVVSCPPWGRRDWGVEAASTDPHGRYRFGLPPRSSADWAYIQNTLAHLNAEGHALLVLPNGPLFRGGAEASIRANVLKADLVDAVIQLPPNLMYGTALPPCMLVLSKRKPAERRGQVLFVEAQSFGKPVDRRRRMLTDEEIARITGAYRRFRDEPSFARIVTLSEIAANDHVLSANRYVSPASKSERISVEREREHLAALEQRRATLEREIDAVLAAFG
jgi:type I restriction enzyme M protein